MSWKERVLNTVWKTSMKKGGDYVGIRADMKRNFPEVDHRLDVWHLSKNITKKLTEKAKKKECADLSLSLDQIHLKPPLVGCQNMWGRQGDVEREVDIDCLSHCQYPLQGFS